MHLITKFMFQVPFLINLVCGETSSGDGNVTFFPDSQVFFGHFMRGFMNRISFDGNSLLDSLLTRVQTRLADYDKIVLPPFRFYHPLCTVNIPETQIEGIAQIRRMGEVVFDMSATQPTLRFAFSWPSVVTNADILITYWGLPRKGHLTWVLTNVTSFQKMKYETTSGSPSLEEYDLTLEDTIMDVTGFSDPGKFTGQVLTEFSRQQKDLLLEVGSMVFKEVVNAALEEMVGAIMSGGGGVGGVGGGGVVPGVPVG